MKTPQQLKDMFLTQAEPLLQEYIDAALGKGKLSSTSTAARVEVWDVLKKLLLQSGETVKVEGGSPEGILKAVECGLCTTDQASKLLQMYKTAKEIEHVGHQGGGGTTFNIQISGLPQDAIAAYAAADLENRTGALTGPSGQTIVIEASSESPEE